MFYRFIAEFCNAYDVDLDKKAVSLELACLVINELLVLSTSNNQNFRLRQDCKVFNFLVLDQLEQNVYLTYLQARQPKRHLHYVLAK
jgi:hypothetical protein